MHWKIYFQKYFNIENIMRFETISENVINQMNEFLGQILVIYLKEPKTHD